MSTPIPKKATMRAGTHQGLERNSRGMGAVYRPDSVAGVDPAEATLRLGGPPLGVTRPGLASLVFLGRVPNNTTVTLSGVARVLVILLNYLSLLGGSANNAYLFVGLGLIVAGFITSTRWH